MRYGQRMNHHVLILKILRAIQLQSDDVIVWVGGEAQRRLDSRAVICQLQAKAIIAKNIPPRPVNFSNHEELV